MVSALFSIREEIFRKWTPNPSALSEAERNNAAQLWEELRSVTETAAWRSTALLAGQLVEASLRSKLVEAGMTRREVQSLWTFSRVVRKTIEKSLLQRSGATRALLAAAIKIRNESSHFAFWHPYTSEREATWTLVLAVLLLDELGFGLITGNKSDFRRWLQTEIQSLGPRTSIKVAGSSQPEGSATETNKKIASSHSLEGIRSAIVLGWEPPEQDFDSLEKIGIASIWHELKIVEKRRAWRALASLSGQIVEAYLKSKIVHAGRQTRGMAERVVLDDLIQRAAKEDLFSRSPGRTTTGADAVHSAEILRNWATHYAFWLRYTSELRATQALTLSVAILESLYPRAAGKFVSPGATPTPEWIIENWRSSAPKTVFNALKSSPSLLNSLGCPQKQVFEYVIRLGALSTIVDLFEWVKTTPLRRKDFQYAVQTSFSDLLRKAYRESLKNLMDLCSVLDRAFHSASADEPSPYAQVFGTLLPINSASLKAVFRLPASRIPLYFAIAANSGGNLLAQGLRCDSYRCGGPSCNSFRCSELIPAFWAKFNPSNNNNPLNMANTIYRMPKDVRADLLMRIPSTFIEDGTQKPFREWLENNLARKTFNLLAYVATDVIELDKSGFLRRLRKDIVDAIILAAGKDPLTELSELPKRAHKLQITEDKDAMAVMEVLLVRTKERDVTGNNTRRILWDLYLYAPSLAAKAVRSAEYALDADLTCSWDAACIAGMLETHLLGSCNKRWSKFKWDQVQFEGKLANTRTVDKWQKLLALLAAFRRAATLGQPVKRSVSDTAREILSNTWTDGSPEASIKLVGQLQEELSRNANQPLP